MLKTGMLIQGDGGKRPYQRFRNRIMFPIRDRRGRVIGFGGRVLDNQEPKYLNSPETPLFHKGNELYGLYEARKSAQDAAAWPLLSKAIWTSLHWPNTASTTPWQRWALPPTSSIPKPCFARFLPLYSALMGIVLAGQQHGVP